MPGASGILAHQTVARAPADGYTLLFTNTSGLAINLVSFKKLPYDPARDFAPVAMVCSLGPQMLSVSAELPVKSVSEFIAYAKANRGKLSMGFDNTAGAAAFAAKLLNSRADLGLARGSLSRRRADDARHRRGHDAGDDQLDCGGAGRRRCRQGAAPRRHIGICFPGLPDLPSLSETVPGVVMNGWFAVVAPAGSPPDVVRRLNAAIGAYLKGPEIQQRLSGFGLATEGAGTPESTAAFIRQEQDNWRALAKELNIEPQ